MNRPWGLAVLPLCLAVLPARASAHAIVTLGDILELATSIPLPAADAATAIFNFSSQERSIGWVSAGFTLGALSSLGAVLSAREPSFGFSPYTYAVGAALAFAGAIYGATRADAPAPAT